MFDDEEDEVLAVKTAPKQRGRPFEQGKSGNPNGRPKGSRNKTTMAMLELLDEEAEAITRRVIERAKKGDMLAIKLVLERVTVNNLMLSSCVPTLITFLRLTREDSILFNKG